MNRNCRFLSGKRDNYQYNREEVLSFLGKGAEDILHISFSDRNACKAMLDQLQVQLWQQKALDTLAFRHQVLNYETAQSLSEDGTIGTIKVFDLHLATAVDADDQKDVLSAEEKTGYSLVGYCGVRGRKIRIAVFSVLSERCQKAF